MKKIAAVCLTAIIGLCPLGSIAMADDLQDERPSVGLALGSGGAGGLAHIAMLQVFDELGVKPDLMAGSSIGAVIGVLYAAGLSGDEVYDVFDDFGGSNLDALSRLVSPSAELGLSDLLKLGLSNGGVIDAGGFIDFIKSKVDARRFEDLAIPMKIVATDYWSGDSIVFDSGDLFLAVEASMAVPVLFAPVSFGDALLVDGGTSNPLPYDLLTDRCDLVVAIDVSGSRKRVNGEQPPLTEMLFNTFEIMQQSMVKARQRNGDADIYIKPNTHDIRLLHFNRIETILEQAQPAAEQLRQALADGVGRDG